MLVFAMLIACGSPGEAEPPPDADTSDGPSGDTARGDDTAADTASDTATDTGGDTGALPAPRTWAAMTAPDLRVVGCGSTEEMGGALAVGGDLDGDGLPELAVGAPGHDEHAQKSYPDLDGDGLDDVALGLPWRGMSEGVGYRGTVALASGRALLDPALPTLREAYGYEAEAHAGAGLTVMDDGDGDGWPDLATSLDGSVVMLGSAAVLSAGTLFVDDAVAANWSGFSSVDHIVAIGDIDGGGRRDLLAWYDTRYAYAIRTEDGAGTRDTTPGIECGACAFAPARDIDGDGAEDLWVLRGADGAAALSTRELLAGTADLASPLATIASPASGLGSAVAEAADATWVGLDDYYTPGGGAARVDVVLGASLSDEDVGARVTTAWTGWEPADPSFADLDGDGVEDMVLQDDGARAVVVFDGARIAAGGELSLCDADWRVERHLFPVAWLEDADGDGAVEVLLEDRSESDLLVRGGRAFLGLVPDDLRVVRASDSSRFLLPLCDLTADGRTDFVELDAYRGAKLVDGRAWVDGYDEATHLLGTLAEVEETSDFGCFADIDGDGAQEIWHDREVYLSSSLDPANTTAREDALAILAFSTRDEDGYNFEGAPVPLGDLDGDALLDHAFHVEVYTAPFDDEVEGIALLPGAALAIGGTLDADAYPPALTYTGPYLTGLAPIGHVDFDRDGLEDLVVTWRTQSGSYDVIGVPAADLLSGAGVEVRSGEVLLDLGGLVPEHGSIALGPPYGEAGVASIVLETHEAASGKRSVLVSFAR